MNKANRFAALLILCSAAPVLPCAAQEINDSNTPLHLLKPDYQVSYGAVDTAEVRQKIDQIFQYIDKETPMEQQSDGTLRRGAFRLGSYEWGITYKALLDVGRVTGNKAYTQYVDDHFQFIAKMYPKFQQEGKIDDAQMEQICHPRALDDCGTMVAAMMRQQGKPGGKLDKVIENYYEFVDKGQMRLPEDSIFARNRPHFHTIWLDDVYMGVPAIAQRGIYTGESRYFDEAARMYLNFVRRMWVSEAGLYRHGYVDGLKQQPVYHWARANGWGMLCTVELLDMLPADHPLRPQIQQQLERHARSLARLQGKDGFWHQLLDRNDSYTETSATAIFTYALAHAVRMGWLDGITYGPVAQLGWHAVSSQITADGRVHGTCVGTGMAFDPAFYYYRPVSSAAAHGYGPALWAASEMLALCRQWHPRTNDSGLHYYEKEQTNPSPLFYLTEDGSGIAVE